MLSMLEQLTPTLPLRDQDVISYDYGSLHLSGMVVGSVRFLMGMRSSEVEFK
jgi:hypothetical protein